MNPVLRLVHEICFNERATGKKREMALAAMDEHDRLRMKLAETERLLKRARDPRYSVMTDLA